jgi:DNA polymerase-3 subunit delta'
MNQHHWPVYGHDWAVQHLRKSLANGRIRHAYLIVGPESVGKDTLARAFTQTVNCTHADEAARPCGECRACKLIANGSHPDVVFAELDAGALKIEEVRTVASKIALKPYEARYRVAIFRDFDKARPQAQDALLKTLEEPPPAAILILMAPSTDSLLPTITSRSQVLSLRPAPVDLLRDALVTHRGADAKSADLLARLSGGRVGWAIRALEDPSMLEQRAEALNLLDEVVSSNRAKRFDIAEGLSKDKLSLYPLLELWQTYWRDVLLTAEGNAEAVVNIDRGSAIEGLARRFLPDDALRALKATRHLLGSLHLNLNLRLALEVLFLDYPGLA